MGLIHRGLWHWWDRGDGIDLRGWATLAGTGRWHWFMGMHQGGSRLDQRDGIDLWGRTMGVWHWLDVGDGIELWGRAMGAHDWIGAMELTCGGALWGHTTLTRSGRWDRFMGACKMTKYHMLSQCKWRYHVSSCLVLRKVCRVCLVKGLVDANWLGWCVRGGYPSVGWRGCTPHVLNHQWVRVCGVLCVR